MEKSKSETSLPPLPASSTEHAVNERNFMSQSQSQSHLTNVSMLSRPSTSSSSTQGTDVSTLGCAKSLRRKSRFGSLARQLLANDSTDGTLSPNSVRGLMNPFRSQLGLPPLQVCPYPATSESEPSNLCSPPSTAEEVIEETPPTPISTTVSPVEQIPSEQEDTETQQALPPQEHSVEQILLPPSKTVFAPPPIMSKKSQDQNIPPKNVQNARGVAAVVPPLSLKSNNHTIVGTPVASKSFCPPPACPLSVTSKQRQQNRSAKKSNSGWRFATETVEDKEYLVMKQLGKGGCGEVSLVMEKETRELFALKKVSLMGLDQRGVDECINEIKLLVELKGTDLVIHIESWELNSVDKTIKIVMECGQCDLSKSINSDKINTLNKIKFIWERMLYIVQSIHSRGIVHSDLKPANFVWVGGNLKIIDFGIANKLQADYTSIATLNPKGTLNFISPETVNQDAFGRTKISPKSDIWSLGCILHFMVFGKTPFQTINHQMAKINAIIQGVTYYPPVPPEFDGSGVISVLQLCFQLDPKRRPTATQLLMHPFLQDRKPNPFSPPTTCPRTE